MIKEIIKQMLKVFWVYPIKTNRIVFRSTHGTKYNCNPKYISEYLQDNYPEKFEIFWLFDKNSIEEHKYLEEKGVKILDQKSLKGLMIIMTARFLIDNHGIMSYIPTRKKQIIINTWHGSGSYKKEYVSSTREHKKYMSMMYHNTTAFISSCARFSKCNLSVVYKSNPEKILEIGTPRNDIFFIDGDKIKNKVKSSLGIPKEKKIVLYAPTFRYDIKTDIYMLDAEKICSACSEKFDGDFVFAVRFHPFIEGLYRRLNTDNIVYTNKYEDMQELLIAADVLITDYSSCMWDASLKYMPCFIYAADLSYYKKSRDFYTPIEDWPFPLAESQNSLCENIECFDQNKYILDVKHHHQELGSFEKGTARKAVANYINENAE